MRPFAYTILVILAAGAAWVGWHRYAPRPPAPLMAPNAQQVDHILIEKPARRLTASLDGAIVMSTNVALGFAPEGDKRQEGDGKTPEGLFKINRRNPQSAFHLSLGIDYPHDDDIERASQMGVEPGGESLFTVSQTALSGLIYPVTGPPVASP